VVAAITADHEAVVELAAAGKDFAARVGADSVVGFSCANFLHIIKGVRSTTKPTVGGRWRKLGNKPGVWEPGVGNPLGDELAGLRRYVPQPAGVPSSLHVLDASGKEWACTPQMFVHDGVAYSGVLSVESPQAVSDHFGSATSAGLGGWEPITADEHEAARTAFDDANPRIFIGTALD
jgi:hypothetical protein